MCRGFIWSENWELYKCITRKTLKCSGLQQIQHAQECSRVVTDLVNSLRHPAAELRVATGDGEKTKRSWTEEKIKVRSTHTTTTNVSHWCHDLHHLVKWRPAKITMVMHPLKTSREMSHKLCRFSQQASTRPKDQHQTRRPAPDLKTSTRPEAQHQTLRPAPDLKRRPLQAGLNHSGALKLLDADNLDEPSVKTPVLNYKQTICLGEPSF